MLHQKIRDAAEAIDATRKDLDCFRTLQISEREVIPRRLDKLRAEVEYVANREREAQEVYRKRREELVALGGRAEGL